MEENSSKYTCILAKFRFLFNLLTQTIGFVQDALSMPPSATVSLLSIIFHPCIRAYYHRLPAILVPVDSLWGDNEEIRAVCRGIAHLSVSHGMLDSWI